MGYKQWKNTPVHGKAGLCHDSIAPEQLLELTELIVQDSLILAAVITVCTLFLLIYWMRK